MGQQLGPNSDTAQHQVTGGGGRRTDTEKREMHQGAEGDERQIIKERG